MTQEEFCELVRELENDTCYYSGFDEIENHSNFIRMKALGIEILPHLIDKLNTNPHWWLFLLFDKIITNKPQIPEESCGVLKDIVQIYKDYFNTKF
jgi:hypothetical protein